MQSVAAHGEDVNVCTNDPDRSRMAERIDGAIAGLESLEGQLIRVVRPAN